jgi:hypothetical protein
MHATPTRHLADPRIGVVTAVAAAIFATGIALGTWIAPDASLVRSPIVVPAGDRSYDAVEATRADRGVAVPAGDRSYDAVEETRADRGASVPTDPQNFDALQKIHAARGTD